MPSASDNYKGAWGNRIGFGRKAAVVMVDFMKAYTIPGAPLFAQGVIRAVSRTPALLDAARRLGVPVIHTNILYRASDCTDGGVWVKKAPVIAALVAGSHLAEFCTEVAPIAGELVITKQYASAFFGTSLGSMLHAQAIDTVIVAGCTTSGCIRATAVDAVQYGFRAIVVRDCVGDRHEDPHNANLFDIDSKYGDVISLTDTLNELHRIAAA